MTPIVTLMLKVVVEPNVRANTAAIPIFGIGVTIGVVRQVF